MPHFSQYLKPVLGSAWELQLRAGRAYLYRKADNQPVGALSGAEAVVLGLMDGTHTAPELAGILTRAIGDKGTQLLEGVQTRFGPLLTDGPPRTDSHHLEALAQALPPDPQEGLRPLPGPRVLHWWVTNYCPRQCVYCFAQPIWGGQAKDAFLARDDLQRIFREAATLGAEYLLVAGAEPLLREDLPECLGDAIRAGIIPMLTTKYLIKKGLARRLAQARVKHISLSLDSVDEHENKFLIGSSSYPAQVRHTIENLQEVGIAFSIQSVVTQLNLQSLHAVAKLAAETNAQMVQFVPFEPVLGLTYPNDVLMLAHPDRLEERIHALAQQFPAVKIERFEKLGTGSRRSMRCDIGMTKLFFLPNGIVHRCYKLIHDQGLQGKDLRKVTVAAAWHDRDFYEILSPAHDAYLGSACYRCALFSECHQDGRCIYEAWVNHDRYAAKDRACLGPYHQ